MSEVQEPEVGELFADTSLDYITESYRCTKPLEPALPPREYLSPCQIDNLSDSTEDFDIQNYTTIQYNITYQQTDGKDSVIATEQVSGGPYPIHNAWKAEKELTDFIRILQDYDSIEIPTHSIYLGNFTDPELEEKENKHRNVAAKIRRPHEYDNRNDSIGITSGLFIQELDNNEMLIQGLDVTEAGRSLGLNYDLSQLKRIVNRISVGIDSVISLGNGGSAVIVFE